MAPTSPPTRASRACATGDFDSASSRASRASALPLTYCSQQPRLPHSHLRPSGTTVMWPNSAPMPYPPRWSTPSTTSPPPIPVPRLTQASTGAPRPAPKRYSAQAPALASFSITTGRPVRSPTTARSGSSRHARWGEKRHRGPVGVDVARCPDADGRDVVARAQLGDDLDDGLLGRRRAGRGSVASYLLHDPAGLVHHPGGHLGATDVDPDCETSGHPGIMPPGRWVGRAREPFPRRAAPAPPRLHRAARLEDAVGGVIERTLRRRGWRPRVLTYTGYGADGWVRVLGPGAADAAGDAQPRRRQRSRLAPVLLGRRRRGARHDRGWRPAARGGERPRRLPRSAADGSPAAGLGHGAAVGRRVAGVRGAAAHRRPGRAARRRERHRRHGRHHRAAAAAARVLEHVRTP